MRSEREIINNIIQNPDATEETIYNQASFIAPNVDGDQSSTVLLSIRGLKKTQREFLQHLLDIVE